MEKTTLKSKWIFAGVLLAGMVFLLYFSACASPHKPRTPKKYTVTIESNTFDGLVGGKIAILKTNGEVHNSKTATFVEGDKVTLKAEPNDQRKLSQIKVLPDDVSVEEIKVDPEISVEVDTYTFTMPASSVTITARFATTRQYNITVSPTYGGLLTLIPSVVKAYEGTTLTVTAEVYTGRAYKKDSISATGDKTKKRWAMNPVEGEVNTWTFTMPSEDVTIWALFVDPAVEDPDDPYIPPEEPDPDKPLPPYEPPETGFEVSPGGPITVDVTPPAGAASYEILRAGSRLGEYTTIIANSSGPSFSDPSPNANKYENWYKIVYKDAGGQTISEEIKSLELEIFGPTMLFYDAQYDNIKDIEREVNRIHDDITFGSKIGPDGKRGEFTTYRHAMNFKPGTYGTRNGSGDDRFTFKVGFYTHFGGLGRLPSDTKLSSLEYDTIYTPGHLPNNNATCTFWRSIENLQIGGAFSGWEGRFHWGVSQAAPARRMKVYADTFFQEGYGEGPEWGWASGGFSADCDFRGPVESYSQQQWYSRNCNFGGGPYLGVNWNLVVQGSTGSVDNNGWDTGHGPTISRTKIDTTPVIREKPFLFIDTDGEYKVFVPALRQEAQGLSYTDGDMGPGEAIDLRSKFHIAKAKDPNGLRAEGDTAATLNSALKAGKHIFFTPGRYELEAPLHVERAGTILLGTGYPTLIPGPTNPKGAVFVEDVDNVTVAGLLFDALYNSTYLLAIGEDGSNSNHSASPTLLADLVLRVGGFSTVHVNVDMALIINSNHVIGDQFWVWRADHGDGIGWDMNTSKNGVIVQGDDVTLYGLFVEHFQEYQTLWLGERGRTYFYQNESPYDPPNQTAYMSHNGTVNGYATYKVANSVNEHYAVGLGMYPCFVQTNQPVLIQNAIEVPNKSGVSIQHACTVNISGKASAGWGATSVVNGTGNSNAVAAVNREVVTSYNNGVAVTPSANKTGIQPADEDHIIPKNLRP